MRLESPIPLQLTLRSNQRSVCNRHSDPQIPFGYLNAWPFVRQTARAPSDEKELSFEVAPKKPACDVPQATDIHKLR
jgi:hypothetical protein